MARGSRRRRSRVVDEAFLSPPLADRLFDPLPSTWSVPSLEDRRTYHPENIFRPAASVTSSDRNVNVKEPAKKFSRALPFGLQFAVPDNVAICVRRKQRREVIFAKRKAGKGARRRNPRRTWHSLIGC